MLLLLLTEAEAYRYNIPNDIITTITYESIHNMASLLF